MNTQIYKLTRSLHFRCKFYHATSWPPPLTAVKQASEITTLALRVNNQQLVQISSLEHWVGGHSSHSSPFPTGVNSSSTPLAPVNSTVVHSQNTAEQLVYHRTQALSGLFSNCHVNDLQIFMSHKSTGFQWTFNFSILILNEKTEEALALLALHSNWAKFVNWQLSCCSTNQIIWNILTRIVIGLFYRALSEYRCTLTPLLFDRKMKFVLKMRVNAGGNNRILYHKTNKEASTVLCSVVKHLGSG